MGKLTGAGVRTPVGPPRPSICSALRQPSRQPLRTDRCAVGLMLFIRSPRGQATCHSLTACCPARLRQRPCDRFHDCLPSEAAADAADGSKYRGNPADSAGCHSTHTHTHTYFNEALLAAPLEPDHRGPLKAGLGGERSRPPLAATSLLICRM